MERLKLLKQCFAEGFISEEEYNIRKSCLIDELTGTKAKTLTCADEQPTQELTREEKVFIVKSLEHLTYEEKLFVLDILKKRSYV